MARRNRNGSGPDYTGGGGSVGGGKGQNGRPAIGWVPDPAAWGDNWGYDEGAATKGAGHLLVHETHAPKKISHIQFGLLNAEVIYMLGMGQAPPLYYCFNTSVCCLWNMNGYKDQFDYQGTRAVQ